MLLNDYYHCTARAEDQHRELVRFFARRRLLTCIRSNRLPSRWQRQMLYRIGGLLIASGTRLKTVGQSEMASSSSSPSSVYS